MYARINPAVKKWIKDIATDAQDSDCMGKNSEQNIGQILPIMRNV